MSGYILTLNMFVS